MNRIIISVAVIKSFSHKTLFVHNHNTTTKAIYRHHLCYTSQPDLTVPHPVLPQWGACVYAAGHPRGRVPGREGRGAGRAGAERPAPSRGLSAHLHRHPGAYLHHALLPAHRQVCLISGLLRCNRTKACWLCVPRSPRVIFFCFGFRNSIVRIFFFF